MVKADGDYYRRRAEVPAETETKAIHPGAAILLGLAVVFFLFRCIGKRKVTV